MSLNLSHSSDFLIICIPDSTSYALNLHIEVRINQKFSWSYNSTSFADLVFKVRKALKYLPWVDRQGEAQITPLFYSKVISR